MRWILEPNVFGTGPHPLADAVARAGHEVIHWNDDWWDTDQLPPVTNERTVFHGSLGNAARIARLDRWSPGAFCNVPGFLWSA